MSQPSDKILVTGHEYPGDNEEKVANATLKLLQDQMVRLYSKDQKQLRQIHPKMNGCVKAEFIVEPSLPAELKVGLFKEARSYPAWLRLSNGKTTPLPDWKKDIRGFAIKLMNVEGKKLEGSTQDFILMNTKSFVSGDVDEFRKILGVVTTPTKFTNFFSKVITAFSCLPLLLRAAKANIKINHPCEIPYFSTVPYRFGDDTKAVKYAVMPSSLNKLEFTDRANKNFLRANLAATLQKHELNYDFFVQFQTDPVKMPVENPTVEWTSPFIKLATIRIPTQAFDNPEQDEFGDNLSFDSWHSLAEHRPIGNFNRVRRIIYNGMYSFRKKHNINKPGPEPMAGPDFFNSTNIQ